MSTRKVKLCRWRDAKTSGFKECVEFPEPPKTYDLLSGEFKYPVSNYSLASDGGKSVYSVYPDEGLVAGREIKNSAGELVEEYKYSAEVPDIWAKNRSDMADHHKNHFHRLNVKYDCDHPSNMWAKECEGDQNKLTTGGKCKKGSKCFDSRKDFCNDPAKFSASKDKCLPFCKDQYESGGCSKTLFDMCAADVNSDPFCKTELMRKDLVSKTCTVDVNSITSNPTCKEFCKDVRNIPKCKEQIKAYCKGANLDTDYCRTLLFDRAMWGEHNEQVQAFCSTPSNAKAALCTCFDASGIAAAFPKLSDALKAQAIKTPECFYRPCATKVVGIYRPSKLMDSTCPAMQTCFRDMQDNPQLYNPEPDNERMPTDSACSAGGAASSKSMADYMKLAAAATAARKAQKKEKEEDGKSSKALLIFGIVGGAGCLCICIVIVLAVILMTRKK